MVAFLFMSSLKMKNRKIKKVKAVFPQTPKVDPGRSSFRQFQVGIQRGHSAWSLRGPSEDLRGDSLCPSPSFPSCIPVC